MEKETLETKFPEVKVNNYISDIKTDKGTLSAFYNFRLFAALYKSSYEYDKYAKHSA
jgi:hypothetical protein